MSAEWRASSGVATFSPRLSRVAVMPWEFTVSAAFKTSSISIPATKRDDIRRPIVEDSEKRRRAELRDKAIKVERRRGIAIGESPFSHSGFMRQGSEPQSARLMDEQR